MSPCDTLANGQDHLLGSELHLNSHNFVPLAFCDVPSCLFILFIPQPLFFLFLLVLGDHTHLCSGIPFGPMLRYHSILREPYGMPVIESKSTTCKASAHLQCYFCCRPPNCFIYPPQHVHFCQHPPLPYHSLNSMIPLCNIPPTLWAPGHPA